MEDWLNDSAAVECNLSASGCQDFHLGEFLQACGVDIAGFNGLFLGDNSTMGSPGLKQAVCRSYERVEPGEVMVTNGSSEALFVFFNELLDPGDEVIIPFPAFQCLYQVPLAIGCKVRYLPLLEDKDWRLDIDRLGRMVTPDTRLIIINNPHNPIGWTLSVEELQEIGRIAQKNDCYLLFDEHYRYLPLEPGVRLIPSGYDACKPINKNTFASGSMIKCFGIVGIRIGWLLGEPGFLARCGDYKDYITHTIPSLTDHLAVVALENKETLIRLQKERILPNLELLDSFMEKNDHIFEYKKPTGGVVCFPRLKNNRDSGAFCLELRETRGVSLLPGETFEVKGHVRIDYGIDRGKFHTALERMKEYINRF
jgi:aspartate/methionine/tyrosine aminotransferase